MISYFSFIIIINLLIFYFYEPIAKLYNVFDYPDYERKIHIHPVPLLGGFFLLINLGLILLLNYYFILIFDNSYFPSIKSLYFFFLTIFFFFLIGATFKCICTWYQTKRQQTNNRRHLGSGRCRDFRATYLAQGIKGLIKNCFLFAFFLFVLCFLDFV